MAEADGSDRIEDSLRSIVQETQRRFEEQLVGGEPQGTARMIAAMEEAQKFIPKRMKMRMRARSVVVRKLKDMLGTERISDGPPFSILWWGELPIEEDDTMSALWELWTDKRVVFCTEDGRIHMVDMESPAEMLSKWQVPVDFISSIDHGVGDDFTVVYRSLQMRRNRYPYSYVDLERDRQPRKISSRRTKRKRPSKGMRRHIRRVKAARRRA